MIKEGIKTINATEGDPSLLICEIEGDIPEIHWYKVSLELLPIYSNIKHEHS